MYELERTQSVASERAVIVGVILPKQRFNAEPLEEIIGLAETSGAKVVATLIQRREKPDNSTYLGSGKVHELQLLADSNEADVILFDDLVSDDVLDLARREAKRMLVGMRGKRQSCRQDDNNALMVKLARQGKHVVRLKSGDPMIFERAGEAAAMEAAQ